MAGPQVLDLARFPTIEFRSRQVSGRRNSDGTYELQIAGELGLHGATRPLSVPVRVQVSGSTITVTGRASVAQRAFGIEPVTAGGGTVKVKNEVGIDFKIVAREK
jgi:polyisoprenoid-binding protein YceI